MSRNTKLIAGLAGIVVVAGALTVRGAETPAADEGVPELALVERRGLEVRAEAAGLVEPIRVVEVKSKASGEVLRLHVETGDDVGRGALLAEIDPRDVRNALAQAEADLAVARARLATAEAQRGRSEELRAANVVTEQEYEGAALEEANARAQLVKAETNLELARERMGDVSIAAPIAGTIIQKSVEVGQIIASASQNISGGTTLYLMADLSEMQVRALVDETDIGRIRPGQVAAVTVEAFPGRTFEGSVLKIEPQAVVEQNVTMFPVLIRLDNREGLLKPGMNAEVAVEIARRDDVVVVPNAAVVSMRDAAAGAAVLGLDPEEVTASLRAGGGARDGVPPAPDASPRLDSAAAARSGAAVSSAADGCLALREKIRAAGGRDGLSEADRAKARECMQRFRGRAGGADGSAGRRPPAGAAEVRPAIVFVKAGPDVEPRRVLLGLSDWDYSEIVSGVEPGEQVVLMSVARLQQQQQEMLDRFRQRAGGGMFGGGQGGGQRGGAGAQGASGARRGG